MTLLDSPKPPEREALLDQLEDEAAMGWPRPWWPQDQADRLGTYIDVVGDVVAEGRRHAHDSRRRQNGHLSTTEGAA